MMAPALAIRPAAPDDLGAITEVYAWNVLHGTGTFEIEPPSREEMTRRHAEVSVTRRLPWLVAERGSQVVGFAYANQFRPRPAYRFALEDSIYLAASGQRQGIGRLLLAELIARCEAAGARQMYAVIGDSANTGSIAVHRACGFRAIGLMRSAGWKFGQWRDVVLMQRALGLGDLEAAPAE
jgi:phosphinothricin acetyltransferase